MSTGITAVDAITTTLYNICVSVYAQQAWMQAAPRQKGTDRNQGLVSIERTFFSEWPLPETASDTDYYWNALYTYCLTLRVVYIYIYIYRERERVVYTCGVIWAIASLGPDYTTSVSNPF